jgi:hypothetical protein
MADRRIEDGGPLVGEDNPTLIGSQAPSIHMSLGSSCQGYSSMLGPELARLTASIRLSLDRIDKIIARLGPSLSEARQPIVGT